MLDRSSLTCPTAFRTGPLIAGSRYWLSRMRPVVIGQHAPGLPLSTLRSDQLTKA